MLRSVGVVLPHLYAEGRNSATAYAPLP
jgi:hypothetical protein